MTETEWLTSEDPRTMLEALHGSQGLQMYYNSGRPYPCVSDRKLRLFARACNAPDPHWDDLVGPAASSSFSPLDAARYSVSITAGPDHAIGPSSAENVERAALLREIVGNPWRPVPKLPTTLGMDVARDIAQAIYDDYAFDRLPILADALEDARCDDAAILDHCRGVETCPACEVVVKGEGGKSKLRVSGVMIQMGDAAPSKQVFLPTCDRCHGTGRVPLRAPHVRGCWAIDLILGKKWSDPWASS
jgi:hypothetical protein